MALADELARIAGLAATHALEGEKVGAVVAAEPQPGARVYLCALERGEERAWVVVDEAGAAVTDRRAVRDAVSIAALCELAADAAAGGDVEALRAQLAEVLATEQVPGIEAVEEALGGLARALGAPPQVASTDRLDAIAVATRRLECELGEAAVSPFAAAMKAGSAAVEELLRDVESSYRGDLT